MNVRLPVLAVVLVDLILGTSLYHGNRLRVALAQEPAVETVLDLRFQERELLEKFGPEHPQVKSLRARIERLSGQPPHNETERQRAVWELRLREQQLLETLGPEHPRVRAIREQIKHFEETPESPGEGLRGELSKLRSQERLLLQDFGPDHPRVIAVRKSIQLLETQLRTQQSIQEPPLWKLRLQEQLLLQTFGPDHPRVQAVRRHILWFEQRSLNPDDPDSSLTNLRLLEKQLLQNFGSDHPELRSIQDRIRVLQRIRRWEAHPDRFEQWLLLQIQSDEGGDRDPDEQEVWIRELLRLWSEEPTLLKLHLQEQELLRNFGPDHPKVMQVRKQIEILIGKLRRQRA
jgi:uncharacterized protein involved in exopolysaccharide biosynthesis